jgi:hypothetical protein
MQLRHLASFLTGPLRLARFIRAARMRAGLSFETPMKDPLQTVKTPYEILGLDPKAPLDNKVLALAPAQAARRGVPMGEATAAAAALRNPLERARHALLLYRPNALSRLAPSPAGDAGCLAVEQREATAESWTHLLKKKIDDADVLHSLAVLYYWWARHDELELNNYVTDKLRSGTMLSGTLRELNDRFESAKSNWLRALGYWSILLQTPEFWAVLPDLAEEQRTALRDEFRHGLLEQLHKCQELYAAEELPHLAEGFQALELELNTELSAVEAVRETALLKHKHSGTYCVVGPLVLDWVGMLEKVRGLVRERLDKKTSERMQRLWKALSPYRYMNLLIETGNPKEALQRIESLPAKESELDEVAALRSRAHHRYANQLVSVGQVGDALDHWEKAIRFRHTQAEETQIRNDVETGCIENSGKIGDEQAAPLLKRALQLSPGSANLTHALANAHFKRGRGLVTIKFNEFVARRNANPDQFLDRLDSAIAELRTDLRAGVEELEQAAAVGSKESLEELEKLDVDVQRLEAAGLLARADRIFQRALQQAQQRNMVVDEHIKAQFEQSLRDAENAEDLGHPNAKEGADAIRGFLHRSGLYPVRAMRRRPATIRRPTATPGQPAPAAPARPPAGPSPALPAPAPAPAPPRPAPAPSRPTPAPRPTVLARVRSPKHRNVALAALFMLGFCITFLISLPNRSSTSPYQILWTSGWLGKTIIVWVSFMQWSTWLYLLNIRQFPTFLGKVWTQHCLLKLQHKTLQERWYDLYLLLVPAVCVLWGWLYPEARNLLLP